MYSPKIKEELIPKLYGLAKAKGIPMTKLVNQILSNVLSKVKVDEEILNEMAEIKSEIQMLQLWIDGAKTNQIAQNRYKKCKSRLKKLVDKHQELTKKLKEGING